MAFNSKKIFRSNKKYLLESHNFQNGIQHLFNSLPEFVEIEDKALNQKENHEMSLIEILNINYIPLDLNDDEEPIKIVATFEV